MSTESPIRNILTYQDGAELVVRLVVQQTLQQIEVVDIDKWNVELICAYIRPAYYKATFTVTQVRVRVSMWTHAASTLAWYGPVPGDVRRLTMTSSSSWERREPWQQQQVEAREQVRRSDDRRRLLQRLSSGDCVWCWRVPVPPAGLWCCAATAAAVIGALSTLTAVWDDDCTGRADQSVCANSWPWSIIQSINQSGISTAA